MYLIALSVVTLVEHKIGDIKIQMPKIEIVKEHFDNKKKNSEVVTEDKKITNNENSNNKEKNEFDNLEKLLSEPTTNNKETTKVTTNEIKCSKDSDCNVVNGNGLNVCKQDGTCHCLAGSGLFCHYGPTNYKDPKDMTASELERFKYKFRNNFTLQDYKNWLILYKEDPHHLRMHHRENLKILLRGGQITDKDIPQVRIKPPMDASDYFQKMYEGGKISVHFPEESSTGAMVGANYNKFSDFIPPEEAENTWITGMVDMYNQPSKDDAKALNFYLRPDVTVGSERALVGDNYLSEIKDLQNNADVRRMKISQKTSLDTFNSHDKNVSTDPTTQLS
jgi:hypothetical protein